MLVPFLSNRALAIPYAFILSLLFGNTDRQTDSTHFFRTSFTQNALQGAFILFVSAGANDLEHWAPASSQREELYWLTDCSRTWITAYDTIPVPQSNRIVVWRNT